MDPIFIEPFYTRNSNFFLEVSIIFIISDFQQIKTVGLRFSIIISKLLYRMCYNYLFLVVVKIFYA